MKLFAIILTYFILILAMMYRLKVVAKKINEAEKRKPYKSKSKNLDWVDKLIDNTLKIKQ